ncbi:MAG: tetratricopeptide repeat protein [Treponemataceae bacterium]|nr:MAG: tetratricopeptide repeat protein [Treponemataceae bacterium]
MNSTAHSPFFFLAPGETPQNFRDELGAFTLDPVIPLPVRGAQPSGNNGEISAEMILSGILAVFAYDKNNEHAPYYKKILLRSRPDIKRELSGMALVKAYNDDFELAEEICLALRGIAPDDPESAFTSALILDRRGEFYRRSGLHDDADACDEEALLYYKQAMSEDIPDAHFNAALFFLRKQDFARAKDCFETYIALATPSAAPGGTQWDGELTETARKKIERAAECVNMINSQNLDDALFKNAYTLISSGQEEKGIAAVKEFLEKNPKVWNAWFLLGWGLRLLGRFDDARQAFLQAENCDGGATADTYNELAICCMELGLLDESETRLKKALRLNPEDSKIMANMGVLMLKMKKSGDARKWFLTALEYNPDDAIARYYAGSSE